MPYFFIDQLPQAVDTAPSGSVLSRTIYKEHGVNATLFAFDAGEGLTEHTASQTAIIQILEGSAVFTLDNQTHELHAGAWLVMPPRLPHSLVAQTPLKMLLLLVKDGA